jgi:Leucine-rich repeat (LRR) protein
MLDHTEVTKEGLEAIARLPLNWLSLSRCHIDDSAVTILCKMRTLESLDISGTSITDVGMNKLSLLPRLQGLDIRDTKVSRQGVAHLLSKRHLLKLLTDYPIPGVSSELANPRP